ncbi:MAG: DNA translocase FtsK 4TM domain-containing protein [Deltaproteobacteria bacterium]
MPKKKISRHEPSPDYISREIVASSLLAVGIFSSLSLLFYSSKSGLDVKNSMGAIGVFISDLLGNTFGLSSFIIPIVMFYTAALVFTDRAAANLYRKAAAAVIFLLILPVLLGLAFGSEGVLGYKPAGGWIGDALSSALRQKIAGDVGSYVIVTVALSVSLIIMSNVSVYGIFNRLGRLFMETGGGAWTMLLGAGGRVMDIAENLFSSLSKPKARVVIKTPIPRERKPIPYTTDAAAAQIKPAPERPKPGESMPQIIVEVQKMESKPRTAPEKSREYRESHNFKLPPIDLLDARVESKVEFDKDGAYEKARLTEEKLSHLGVSGNVTEIRPGPVITMFEYKPAPGIKINKIAALENDLAMGLSALSIRIIAPIPGKDVVGIEVPNSKRESVVLRELLEDGEFIGRRSTLTLALGKDIAGKAFYMDLRKAPHLMIAGTTGSGKSVLLHSVITSMLYKGSPAELKFIMIDPKMLELSVYEDIPHLLHPVVTEPKKAAAALRWAVDEMEKRYKTLSEEGVRDIESYNKSIEKLPAKAGRDERLLPYIVIVIDELADLMMVAPHEVREGITRLSQKARAAGIHLIVATQRPSADVVAGLIKANFPARISFLVSSKIDSRIILDAGGAERLLGKGDMLFLQPGTSKLTRVQGGLISDGERERITDYLKSQGSPEYNQEITKFEEQEDSEQLDSEKDEFYFLALKIIAETRQASISMIQRKLKIGYNRAARIVEIMEKEGLVGPQEAAGKQREVFISPEYISKERHKN